MWVCVRWSGFSRLRALAAGYNDAPRIKHGLNNSFEKRIVAVCIADL